MLEESSNLQRLVALGLTSYEARAYVALIQRESFAAAEVANITRIPRQRVYDVLNGLVQRGLARVWPGQVSRYTAVPPDTAVERLLAVQRGALSALESESHDLANALGATFASGREASAPLEFVEVLREQSLLSERFAELQREASSELLTYSKPLMR
ncbi:MAG TPA: helix-turn-helix domain-containing protein [Jatrophihabitans sp.]